MPRWDLFKELRKRLWGEEVGQISFGQQLIQSRVSHKLHLTHQRIGQHQFIVIQLIPTLSIWVKYLLIVVYVWLIILWMCISGYNKFDFKIFEGEINFISLLRLTITRSPLQIQNHVALHILLHGTDICEKSKSATFLFNQKLFDITWSL